MITQWVSWHTPDFFSPPAVLYGVDPRYASNANLPLTALLVSSSALSCKLCGCRKAWSRPTVQGENQLSFDRTQNKTVCWASRFVKYLLFYPVVIVSELSVVKPLSGFSLVFVVVSRRVIDSRDGPCLVRVYTIEETGRVLSVARLRLSYRNLAVGLKTVRVFQT